MRFAWTQRRSITGSSVENTFKLESRISAHRLASSNRQRGREVKQSANACLSRAGLPESRNPTATARATAFFVLQLDLSLTALSHLKHQPVWKKRAAHAAWSQITRCLRQSVMRLYCYPRRWGGCLVACHRASLKPRRYHRTGE